MDMDWWKSFFEIGGVVLLFLTFAFGAGFMLTGKKVNEAQAERLRTFDSDLTGAKTEMAKQQTRAAVAEGNIALAEQHAKEADAKAEGFRLAIAKASENAAKAQENLAEANKRAAEADAKAEGFRSDIARANESAEQARAQVATATANAARANLELARIKSPRTFALTPDILAAFQQYPGTEYTFATVATDQDSIDLLKQIDSALQGAGWKRVKLDPPAVMGVNLFGDNASTINVGILKGVNVEVGCVMDADTLQKIPPATWPMPVKLAGALRSAIASLTTPISDANVAPSVEVTKGASEVIRISVGSKP